MAMRSVSNYENEIRLEEDEKLALVQIETKVRNSMVNFPIPQVEYWGRKSIKSILEFRNHTCSKECLIMDLKNFEICVAMAAQKKAAEAKRTFSRLYLVLEADEDADVFLYVQQAFKKACKEHEAILKMASIEAKELIEAEGLSRSSLMEKLKEVILKLN